MLLARDQADAEDLVQKTYIRAIREAESLRAGCNATDIAIETSPDPYAHYVGKTERERVREAIQQLSSEFREIILLRKFEELTYQEIANLLGCPIGDSDVTFGQGSLQTPDIGLSLRRNAVESMIALGYHTV